MPLQITGKHMDLGEALRTHCTEAFQKLTAKYHMIPTQCTIWFDKQTHHQFVCEISLHLGRGVYIRAHVTTDEPYLSFDRALVRVDEKIARHKERIDDHHKHHDTHKFHKLSAMDAVLDHAWADTRIGERPAILSEHVTEIPVLSVDGAAMQLELTDSHCVIFRHKDHGRTNVLYRRPDGKLSWVDVNAS
jgi:ribosomal subunit interface protein